MTLEQTESLLKQIHYCYYDEYSDVTVERWYQVLKHYDFEPVYKNLIDFIKKYTHAPGLNEIISGLNRRPAILH